MKMYVGILLFFLLYGTFFVHSVIEYHYINLQKTWEDAQQYCRENYTDLATLENAEDVNKLQIPTNTWAWIGLFDDPASWKGMTSDSNSWRWSSTGTTSPGGYQNWASGQPDNYGGKESCVVIQNGLWWDYNCAGAFQFFCYNVQPSGLKEYILITTPKSWSDSQSYCRQNHHDLAMIETSAENKAVTDLLPTTTEYVWIGLYRISWRWSNGSPSTYRKWLSGEPDNIKGSESCCIQGSEYVWGDTACTDLRSFVCQRVVTSSANSKIIFNTTADMSDAANRDAFLKVLENHLGFGYSVSWISPPTKEKKKSPKDDECTDTL